MSITTRPEWLDNDDPTYTEIVRGFDYEIVSRETFGSYNGDIVYLLEDHEDNYGLLVVGYGSCTECDDLAEAVEAVEERGDFAEVVTLANRLHDRIHWESSRAELMEWINGQSGNHWWCHDPEIAAWLNERGANITDHD